MPSLSQKHTRTRPATDEDRDFILDAWLNGYRRSKYAGTIPNNLYDRVYSALIQQLIDRGMEITILEAKPETGIDCKLGFVAFERSEQIGTVIHWLYVKDEFRGHGLGTQLLSEASVSSQERFLYTHRTAYSRYFRKARHAPQIARRRVLNLSNQNKRTYADQKDPQNRSEGQTGPKSTP